MAGLSVFPPSQELFQFLKQKEITWNTGVRQNCYFSLFKNAVTIAQVSAETLLCRRWVCLQPVAGRRF